MFDLFNQPTGAALRDIGIQTASDHAEKTSPEWNEKAYKLLVGFIARHGEFTCEEFRAWAENQIDAPPSLRAYGGIINRAAKAGLIEQIGYKKTSNPKSHRTPAGLWRRT